MSLSDVQQAIETKLAATLTDWVFEGDNSDPGAAVKLARVFFVPGPISPATLSTSGENECYGFTQVDLKYPVGTGDSAARADYSTLYNAFTLGTWVSSGSQYVELKGCDRTQGRQSSDRYVVSVTINWYARLPR